MDHPEFVTPADRGLLIGVLANLATAFRGPDDTPAGDTLTRRMKSRYRDDLEYYLGHRPSQLECFEAIEGQIERIRYSLGEFD